MFKSLYTTQKVAIQFFIHRYGLTNLSPLFSCIILIMKGKQTKIKDRNNSSTNRKTSVKYAKKKQYYEDILKVDPGKLRSYHYKYIHTEYPKWCCKTYMKPMFNDIGPYQWKKLNIKLQKIYNKMDGLSFYRRQALVIKKLAGQKSINLGSQNNVYLDQLLLDYHKSKVDCRIVTAFPSTTDEELTKLKTLLKSEYIIYGHKKISLSGKAAAALLYQLTASDSNITSHAGFSKLSNKYGWNDESDIKSIDVWLVDTISYKNVVKLQKKLKSISPNVQCDSYFIKSVESAQIYFNKNSLDFLEKQSLKRHLGIKFKKCRTFMNTFKKWVYMNCDLINKDRFLILSGGMLYTYGLRSCNDLDMLISPYPNPINTDMKNKIHKYLIDEKTMLPFIDAYEPKMRWLDFWHEWHETWAGEFGAKNMLETIHNPEFHFYFMGLKFIILEGEISRRNLRSRPSAIADLIMIEKLLGIKTTINPVYSKIIKDDKILKYPKDKFVKYVKYYLKSKYNYVMSASDIVEYVNFGSHKI